MLFFKGGELQTGAPEDYGRLRISFSFIYQAGLQAAPRKQLVKRETVPERAMSPVPEQYMGAQRDTELVPEGSI